MVEEKPKYTEAEKEVLNTHKQKKKVADKSILKSFPKTAYWRQLKPNENCVPEPSNPTFKQPRAPTVEEREAQYDIVKHNFDEQFDIPVFKATYKEQRLGRNKRPVFVIEEGERKPVYDKKIQKKPVKFLLNLLPTHLDMKMD